LKKLIIWAMIAISIGAVCVLTGCARKESPNTVVLTTDDLITTRKAYQHAIDRFEAKNRGWHVRHIEISGSNYYQKMLTMFAGNSDPDLLWLGQGLGVFAGKGLLADVQPFIDQDPVAQKLTSELHPKALAAYRKHGKLYGIPFGVDVQYLAYNKDIFDRYGVKYPNDSWTRNDVLAAAMKLTKWDDEKTKKRVKIYGILNAPNPFAFGVDIFSPDGRKVMIDSPETRSYLQFAWDITKNKNPAYNVSPDQDIEKTMGMTVLIAFATGRAAMTAMEDYSIEDVRMYSYEGAKWDLALMPRMGDKERRTWASTAGFCMSDRSQHKKMAFQMLKELASPEFMREFYPQTLPANMKTLKEVVMKDKKLTPNSARTIIESMKFIRIPPRIANFFEADTVVNDESSKLFIEDLSIDQEQQTAKIEEIVKQAAKDLAPLVDK